MLEKNIFTKTVRLVIGIVFVVAAVILDIVAAYAYEYNSLVSVLAVVGVLSLISALFSVKYIPYMLVNLFGFILGLIVVSKSDALGYMFTVLFLIIIFLAMWVGEMLISKKETPAGKILGSLLVNAVTVALVLLVTFVIIFISIVMLL